MTPEQKTKMLHALGLDQADKPYRNRYATTRASDDAMDWHQLVDEGMAVVAARSFTQTIFGVTDEGMAALGVIPLDGLEPSERYRAFQSYAVDPAPSGLVSDEGERNE